MNVSDLRSGLELKVPSSIGASPIACDALDIDKFPSGLDVQAFTGPIDS